MQWNNTCSMHLQATLNKSMYHIDKNHMPHPAGINQALHLMMSRIIKENYNKVSAFVVPLQNLHLANTIENKITNDESIQNAIDHGEQNLIISTQPLGNKPIGIHAHLNNGHFRFVYTNSMDSIFVLDKNTSLKQHYSITDYYSVTTYPSINTDIPLSNQIQTQHAFRPSELINAFTSFKNDDVFQNMSFALRVYRIMSFMPENINKAHIDNVYDPHTNTTTISCRGISMTISNDECYVECNPLHDDSIIEKSSVMGYIAQTQNDAFTKNIKYVLNTAISTYDAQTANQLMQQLKTPPQTAQPNNDKQYC